MPIRERAHDRGYEEGGHGPNRSQDTDLVLWFSAGSEQQQDNDDNIRQSKRRRISGCRSTSNVSLKFTLASPWNDVSKNLRVH